MQLERLPSIWVESPSTINYATKAPTIEKAKRFEYNSIYWKDDPTKPKKKIDQSLFPRQLLDNFRKCIRDASKSKSKDNNLKKRLSSYDEEDGQKSMMSNKATSVTKRLYKKPESLPPTRDFFGNRCSLQQKRLTDLCQFPTFETKSLNKSGSTEKLYISASKRLDLSRPINFNPGPGSYLVEYHLEGKSKLAESFNGENSVLKRRKRQKVMLQSLSSGVTLKQE